MALPNYWKPPRIEILHPLWVTNILIFHFRSDTRQHKGSFRAERNMSYALCFRTVNNRYFSPDKDFPEDRIWFSDAIKYCPILSNPTYSWKNSPFPFKLIPSFKGERWSIMKKEKLCSISTYPSKKPRASTSVALDFVSSRVCTKSKLSNMFPVEDVSSRRRESSRSFSKFLLSLVSWMRCSLCSSNSLLSKPIMTLSNWSSRPFSVTTDTTHVHTDTTHVHRKVFFF